MSWNRVSRSPGWAAFLVSVVAVLAVACGRQGVQTGEGEPDSSPTPGDTQPDDGDDTPTPDPKPEEIRFVALGDTGTGSDDQYQVADAIEAKCAEDGCDFGVLLGDNFYPTGVEGVDDPQWQAKLEEPYENLDFPIYLTLGNHDYGGDGAGYEFLAGQHQVAYAAESEKWILPAEYYSFVEGPATFLALGTNLLMYDYEDAVEEQGAYFTDVIDENDQPWVIAVGHHPYISNGPHGNAGSYDDLPFLPIASGENVKEFFDDYVCGRIDLYLSGHDHSRQILPGTDACPNWFVVSGAGAKTTDLPRDNPTEFQDAYEGFAYIVMTEDTLTVEMYDMDGLFQYEHEITQ